MNMNISIGRGAGSWLDTLELAMLRWHDRDQVVYRGGMTSARFTCANPDLADVSNS